MSERIGNIQRIERTHKYDYLTDNQLIMWGLSFLLHSNGRHKLANELYRRATHQHKHLNRDEYNRAIASEEIWIEESIIEEEK